MKRLLFLILTLLLCRHSYACDLLMNPFIISEECAEQTYEASSTITSVIWDHYETDQDGDGSDLWGMTMNSNGDVIGCWGDGWGYDGCSANESYKTSFGCSQMTGTPESYTTSDVCGESTNCGADSNYCFANYPSSTTNLFPSDVISIGGTLYTWVYDEDALTRTIYKSTDDAETWSEVAATAYDADTGDLHPNVFCHFTQDANYDASDYVYMLGYIGNSSGTLYLWRVDKTEIEDKANYEIFTGTYCSPSWSTSETNKQSVFVAPDSEVFNAASSFQYNATYSKYIYTYFGDKELSQLRMYESANPYGPWYLVDSDDTWGSLGATTFATMHPINEWTIGSGNIQWYIYTGNSTYDNFNLIRVVYNGYLQDYTGFTEVDPSSHITVNSEFNIDFSGVTRQEAAYVYYDFGANYFDGDFTHSFDFVITDDVATANIHLWAVSNSIGDWKTILDASGSMLTINCYNGGVNDHLLQLKELDAGTDYETTGIVITQNSRVYVEVERDINVGTYGTLYIRAYSDYNRSSSIGSDSLTLHSDLDYRYGYALMSVLAASAAARSGNVRNHHME